MPAPLWLARCQYYDRLRQKSWSPRPVFVWRHCQTSFFGHVRENDNLVADKDAKNPPPQKKKKKKKKKERNKTKIKTKKKTLPVPHNVHNVLLTLHISRYMKYLYPYECDKLKLSNPSELQAAIDGNRREGRRSSYGYDMSPGPTLVPSSHPLNGGLMNGKMGRSSPRE